MEEVHSKEESNRKQSTLRQIDDATGNGESSAFWTELLKSFVIRYRLEVNAVCYQTTKSSNDAAITLPDLSVELDFAAFHKSLPNDSSKCALPTL